MAGRRVADLRHTTQVQSCKPAEHNMVKLPRETAEDLLSHVGGIRRAAKAEMLGSRVALAADDTKGVREKTAYKLNDC